MIVDTFAALALATDPASPDTPLESVFGYITVLPSAISTYKNIALRNDQMEEGLLQKYFLGEKMHGAGTNIFAENMYLSSPRIE